MKRYIIRDAEAGNPIEDFETEKEALDALFMYEMTDISEGTYEKGFYEVYDVVKGETVEL